MSPGPQKSFDPDVALQQARDLFWRRGFDGTGIRDLEAGLGVGRKSLYDTFGSKRELFLSALNDYTENVIGRICGRLEHTQGSALQNLEQALARLGKYHGSGESDGCLLGVSMGQAEQGDAELAQVLAGFLGRLEASFENVIKRGIDEGSLRPGIKARDAARNLVALTQGMALLGRIGSSSATQRSIVRAALDGLRA